MAPNLLQIILTQHLLWGRGIKGVSHPAPKKLCSQVLGRVLNLLFSLEISVSHFVRII